MTKKLGFCFQRNKCPQNTGKHPSEHPFFFQCILEAGGPQTNQQGHLHSSCHLGFAHALRKLLALGYSNASCCFSLHNNYVQCVLVLLASADKKINIGVFFIKLLVNHANDHTKLQSKQYMILKGLYYRRLYDNLMSLHKNSIEHINYAAVVAGIWLGSNTVIGNTFSSTLGEILDLMALLTLSLLIESASE